MKLAEPLEPLVSTNALLFLLLPTLGMMLVTGGAVGPYFAGGGLLVFSLLSVAGPLIYLVLGNNQNARTDQRRFWWALAVCSVLVIGLAGRQLVVRSNSPVEGIYDGAIQAEVAAGKLVAGENPYGSDYRGTDYETVNPPIVGGPVINIVWSHFIYPPLIFLLYVPLHLMRAFLGPLADYRLITVGALGGLSAILILTAATWTQRTRATLLTLGNPLLWIYAVIGANDIIIALCLVAAAMLMSRRRWWWSGVIFGLALAARQTVWPLAPLWGLWLWRSSASANTPIIARRRGLLGAAVGLVVTYGPFLAWQPWRLVDDIIRFASGSISYTYPIAGTTFLQYLTVFNLVDSPWSIFPTYLFQLAVGVPVLWLTWRWIRREASPVRWLAGAGVLMMAVLLFGRYFNNNYYTVPMVLFVVAYLLSENEAPPAGSGGSSVIRRGAESRTEDRSHQPSSTDRVGGLLVRG